MTRTRGIKIFSLLLTTLLLIFSLAGCIWNWGDEWEEITVEQMNGPTLRSTYNEEDKCYDVYVEGIIKNVDGDDAYITLTVVVYDEDGNVIKSEFDSIDGVGKGETWRYCVYTTTNIEPSSARVKDLVGYED